MSEKRYTSETGGQKGVKDARLGGADPRALLELARVYGMGEEKYDRYNYLKGYPWSLSVDALLRHLLAFLDGEDRDPESGLLHTAHVAWHALALTAFQKRGLTQFDDRVKAEPRKQAPVCCGCPGAAPHDGECWFCDKHFPDLLVPGQGHE